MEEILFLLNTTPTVAINVIAMVIGLIVAIISCEMKLAKHFSKDGNPKS